MDDDVTTERLVADLGAAHDAATAAVGREPLGVRAVEPVPGMRGYLCAFEGPSFLCLSTDFTASGTVGRVHEMASAALLWECLELLVDPDALDALAEAIGRLLALGGDPRETMDALERVAARALELSRWRAAPERAIASMAAMEEATGLQERLHAAYSLFVRASEPLVERQDTLPSTLVGALRAVEQAAGMARVAERLADLLARSMPECAAGADEVVELHATALSSR